MRATVDNWGRLPARSALARDSTDKGGSQNMDLAEIERRLTRLEDIEAIKQLKARYCEICDDDHNPDRITLVFAEDGIWESAEFGNRQGPRGNSQAVSRLP